MGRPKLLVFASGGRAPGEGGSGFKNLVLASRDGRLDADIVAVVSNHPAGGVNTKAWDLQVPFFHFPAPWTAEAYQDLVGQIASLYGAGFFALSGWLKKVVGLKLTTPFNSRTVFNIHPGPIPAFGGPGMHGHHVHDAVIAAYGRSELTHSAVCMHFVDSEYDHGPVFFRCNVPILDKDTPETLSRRVNYEEHCWQPQITNLVVHEKIRWDGENPGSLVLPADYQIDHETA
jgi:folate-dependent phosphoribosylglycinamide formyltransferase PurN